jgi:hypothetical protein
MERSISRDSTRDQDRTGAEQALVDAQRNPVLSGAQSCAVAQVHALLAIEQRLAQLCTSVDAALVALVNGNGANDIAVAVASPSRL